MESGLKRIREVLGPGGSGGEEQWRHCQRQRRERERDVKDEQQEGRVKDAEEEECVSVVEISMTGRKQEERIEAGDENLAGLEVTE